MNLCIRSGGRQISKDLSPPGRSRPKTNITATEKEKAQTSLRPKSPLLRPKSSVKILHLSSTILFLLLSGLAPHEVCAQGSSDTHFSRNFSYPISDAETVDINLNDASLANAFEFFPSSNPENSLSAELAPLPITQDEIKEEARSAELIAVKIEKAFSSPTKEEAEISDQEIRAMYRELLANSRTHPKTFTGINLSQLTEQDFVEIHRLYLEGQRLSLLHRDQVKERLTKAGMDPDDPNFAEKVEDIMLKDMLANNIHTSVEHLGGKVELNAVADHGKYHYFIRVVHFPTSLSITFPDASSFVERLHHFKKYIGRQFFVANRSVLNIPMENNKPVGMQYYPIPDNWKGGYPTLRSVFSSYYWTNYFRAIWKSPDYPVDGATAALLLAAEIIVMLPVDMKFGNMGISQYLTKTLFGLGIGTHARVLKNWQQMKGRLTPDGLDKVSSTLKQMMISVPFGAALAAGMVFTSEGGDIAATAEVIRTNFFSMSGSVLANAVISGFFKDEVMQIVRSLSQARLLQNMTDLEASSKNVHQRFFGNFRGDNGIGQTVRVFTGLVRYVDIILTNPVVANSFGGPLVVNTISKLSFFALSIIPMHLNALIFYRLKRSAQKKHLQNPEALDLKARYNKIKGTYEDAFSRLTTFYKSFYKIPLALLKLIRHPINFFRDMSKPTADQIEEEMLAKQFRESRKILNETNFDILTNNTLNKIVHNEPSRNKRSSQNDSTTRIENPDSFLSNFSSENMDGSIDTPPPSAKQRDIGDIIDESLTKNPPTSSEDGCGDTFK